MDGNCILKLCVLLILQILIIVSVVIAAPGDTLVLPPLNGPSGEFLNFTNEGIKDGTDGENTELSQDLINDLAFIASGKTLENCYDWVTKEKVDLKIVFTQQGILVLNPEDLSPEVLTFYLDKFLPLVYQLEQANYPNKVDLLSYSNPVFFPGLGVFTGITQDDAGNEYFLGFAISLYPPDTPTDIPKPQPPLPKPSPSPSPSPSVSPSPSPSPSPSVSPSPSPSPSPSVSPSPSPSPSPSVSPSPSPSPSPSVSPSPSPSVSPLPTTSTVYPNPTIKIFYTVTKRICASGDPNNCADIQYGVTENGGSIILTPRTWDINVHVQAVSGYIQWKIRKEFEKQLMGLFGVSTPDELSSIGFSYDRVYGPGSPGGTIYTYLRDKYIWVSGSSPYPSPSPSPSPGPSVSPTPTIDGSGSPGSGRGYGFSTNDKLKMTSPEPTGGTKPGDVNKNSGGGGGEP